MFLTTMKASIILSLCLILYGCGSDQISTRSKDTTINDTLQPDGTITDTTELPVSDVEKAIDKTDDIVIFKGLYIAGNELSSFRDCSNNRIYWLEDESKKLTDAYKKTAGFLSYPYESIYIEVKGYLKGKSNVGYAEEYENVLVVKDLVSAKQKSFSTECFKYEFIALGNEPFWSIDIIPSEKIIAIKDVGNEKTYTFPYRSSKSSGNIITYESANDKRESLKVVITKESCSDGMSDRSYNYSARVILNGTTLKGCAIKKGERVSMNH